MNKKSSADAKEYYTNEFLRNEMKEERKKLRKLCYEMKCKK